MKKITIYLVFLGAFLIFVGVIGRFPYVSLTGLVAICLGLHFTKPHDIWKEK